MKKIKKQKKETIFFNFFIKRANKVKIIWAKNRNKNIAKLKLNQAKLVYDKKTRRNAKISEKTVENFTIFVIFLNKVHILTAKVISLGI